MGRVFQEALKPHAPNHGPSLSREALASGRGRSNGLENRLGKGGLDQSAPVPCGVRTRKNAVGRDRWMMMPPEFDELVESFLANEAAAGDLQVLDKHLK